jgi:hypothetical protein
MALMTVIGGGGGGGSGDGDASTFGRTGGGGGGSSGVTKLLVSLDNLPDVLYVQVGAGGVGGPGAVAGLGGQVGGSGLISYVCVAPNNAAAPNVLVKSGSAGPTGGGWTTSTPVGGNAGTIAVIAQMPGVGLGSFVATAGQAGVAAPGVNLAGSNMVIPVTGSITMGGGGGGGVTTTSKAGGGCTAIAGSYLSQFAPAAPAAGTNNGSGGFEVRQPLFMFGGCGGASSSAGPGGAGGAGIYGSGGGGGGGGLNTGGNGGNGGDGIVIILCW